MTKRVGLFFLSFSLLLVACNHEDTGVSDDQVLALIAKRSGTGQADFFTMPETGDYRALPNQDPRNPITAEKVRLGQQLFFETGFAQDANTQLCYETFSCATCHVPESGFLPGRIQGIADGAFGFGYQGSDRHIVAAYQESELDAQGIRPLTVMNVTYMTNTLWSGTFGATDRNEGTEEFWTDAAEVNHTGLMGLEAQNIEGQKLHRMSINAKMLYDFGYVDLFDDAFPDIPAAERYTPLTASFALSAYLRSLLTNEAPFQQYLKGDRDALTESEKKGALLFFGKANCVSCHSGASFSSMNFAAIGAKDLYEAGGVNTSADDPRNLGRASLTHNAYDMFRFKVPQLYNLMSYATYFHGSSKQSIEEVVDYKIAAESENPNVPTSEIGLQPLDLTRQERQDLINFLTSALYDANMDRYVPKAVMSGYCFPNNDQASRIDLGCN